MGDYRAIRQELEFLTLYWHSSPRCARAGRTSCMFICSYSAEEELGLWETTGQSDRSWIC